MLVGSDTFIKGIVLVMRLTVIAGLCDMHPIIAIPIDIGRGTNTSVFPAYALT